MNKKNIFFYGLIILSTLVISLIFIIFRNNNLKNEAKNIAVKDTKNIIIENNVTNNTIDEVSSSLDNNVKNLNTIETEIEIDNEVKPEVSSISKNVVNEIKEKEPVIENEPKIEEFKVLAPVDGEISKDFAGESLLYSETLKEWTTHMGIDIKAEKTTIVKCAYNGVVESIKNDPRYGLTIIINHENGFKTIYSNLLTTEFVQEGEKVEEGKTIATVGETASFESLEEPHLHFEILKDDINVNPTLYLK